MKKDTDESHGFAVRGNEVHGGPGKLKEAGGNNWDMKAWNRRNEFACDLELMETAGLLHADHNTELLLKELAKEVKKVERKLWRMRSGGVFQKREKQWWEIVLVHRGA